MQRSTLTLTLIAAAAAAALILGAAPRGSDAPDPAPTVPTALDCSEYANGTPTSDGIPGVCYLPTTVDGYPTIDTTGYGTDIPRCASDDWNSTGLPRCYTERVTDGAIVILNESDAVIAALTAA